MKFRNVLGLAMLMLIAIGFFTPVQEVKAQPIQTSSLAKYVGTSEDTVTFAGTVIRRQILVTNHSATKNLIVYCSDKLGVKLTNSYTVVPPGKSAKIWGTIKRVYRHAESDSCFSQVLLGEIELRGYKPNEATGGFGRDVINTPGFLKSKANGKAIRYSYKFPK